MGHGCEAGPVDVAVVAKENKINTEIKLGVVDV